MKATSKFGELMERFYSCWLMANALTVTIEYVAAAGRLGDRISFIIADGLVGALPPPLSPAIGLALDPCAALIRSAIAVAIFKAARASKVEL